MTALFRILAVVILLQLTLVSSAQDEPDSNTASSSGFLPRCFLSSLAGFVSTIDSGGGFASGGQFKVQGTIGQFDVDPFQPATGGLYTVISGFWVQMPGRIDPEDIFFDGFENCLTSVDNQN